MPLDVWTPVSDQAVRIAAVILVSVSAVALLSAPFEVTRGLVYDRILGSVIEAMTRKKRAAEHELRVTEATEARAIEQSAAAQARLGEAVAAISAAVTYQASTHSVDRGLTTQAEVTLELDRRAAALEAATFLGSEIPQLRGALDEMVARLTAGTIDARDADTLMRPILHIVREHPKLLQQAFTED